MKKIKFFPLFLVLFQFASAQYMIVGKDSISLENFKKDNLYGLQNAGIEKTLQSTQDFHLLQQFAAEKKADTTTAFRNRLAQREDELRNQYFYPQNIVDEVLKNYVAANQVERNALIFMMQKSADDKNDYKQVYSDVKAGKITMEDAITKYTKNAAKPIYMKPGVLDNKMYDELTKIPVGAYTSLTDNSSYVFFAKNLGSRPSLGYMIFGTLSYPNDANAEALKTKIYADLKSGKKFQEVTKLYGSNENEKENGGAVMGSPVLPDEVYNVLKGQTTGYYSQPVLLDNKYYIFNIYNLEPYQITEKNKEFFKQEMMNTSYGMYVIDKLVDKLKTAPQYKVSADFQSLKKSYLNFQNFKKDNAVLYQYFRHQKTFADFKKELTDAVKDLDKTTADQWSALLDMKMNQDLLTYYSDDFLKQKNIKTEIETFKRNLYSEYIFTEYLRKEVDTNPKWLEDYYNAHKDKYMWETRAKGRVAILADDKMKSEIESQMKDAKNWEALKTKYYGKLTDKKQILVHFEEGDMSESADIFKKYNVPFKKGTFSTKMNERTIIVSVDEILPPSQMSFEESKEMLRDAVTEQKLQQTIAEQRAKTKIIVQPAFMSDLQKNFKK